jgi:hypothetical protein
MSNVKEFIILPEPAFLTRSIQLHPIKLHPFNFTQKLIGEIMQRLRLGWVPGLAGTVVR